MTEWMVPFLGALSPKGPRGALTVLIFHRVGASVDPLFPAEPDTRRFDELLTWTKRLFQVLPLTEAVERLKAGRLPARAASITFDDGYADNCTNALPLLAKHGLPATIFVSTGYLDGGRMWNDTVIESIRRTPNDVLDLTSIGLGRYGVASIAEKRKALGEVIKALKHRSGAERQAGVDIIAEQSGAELPNDLMLSADQVRALRAGGMEIGAHTVTHPILARCDDSEAEREIRESREHLEHIVGERVGLFAYPNGRPGRDYTSAHVRMVEAMGFDAALSTVPGASRQGDDLFQLRRFTPWDRTPLRFALRFAQNLMRKPSPAAP